MTLQGRGLFHKVALHGDIVAASIVSFSEDGNDNSLKIMIANWKTGHSHTLFPRFLQVGSYSWYDFLDITKYSLSP